MASLRDSARRLKGHTLSLEYYWQALIVVVVGTFMVMLDTTIVNIALPRITTVFGVSVDEAQLVLTCYMLALAVVMPTSGFFTDTFGTKRMYIIVMGLFTLGSVLCGLAWNIQSLILFRVIQGLGGGLLMPLGTTIIYKVVPPQNRGTVMGVFGVPLLFAPVLGPTVGGYLVEYVDWRTIFTLNVPVGILGMVLGTALLKETDLVPGLRFDIPGFILSGIGFGSLLLGLSQGTQDGWDSLFVIILLFVGISALIIWMVVELSSEYPLLELRVFKNATYCLATAVGFVTTLAMYASMLLLPLFLQNLKGLGALEAGLLTFPQAIASGLTMPISGRLFDRIGPRPLIISGLLITAYSTWQMATLNLATSDNELRWLLILRGAGMGIMMMPAMTVAMNTIPPHLIARASSLTNVVRQIFGSFGTAVFATLLLTRQSFHQAMLSQAVTPESPAVQSLISSMQRSLTPLGATAAQAKEAAILLLTQQVGIGAAVRAFDDGFLIAAILMLFGLVPSLFLNSTGITSSKGARPSEPIEV